MDKIAFAEKYAMLAHEGQHRKYTGEPYVEHCFAVAEMLYTVFATDPPVDAICAALLHDTVEDTEVTIEDIQKFFGDHVAEYVWYLTKPPSFAGNREKRKELDRARLSAAPKIVKLIKTLDLMHNAQSIQEHDQKFWKTFRGEAIALLDAMNAQKVFLELVDIDHQSLYNDFVSELIKG